MGVGGVVAAGEFDGFHAGWWNRVAIASGEIVAASIGCDPKAGAR